MAPHHVEELWGEIGSSGEHKLQQPPKKEAANAGIGVAEWSC